jgi:glycerate-2-kinase
LKFRARELCLKIETALDLAPIFEHSSERHREFLSTKPLHLILLGKGASLQAAILVPILQKRGIEIVSTLAIAKENLNLEIRDSKIDVLIGDHPVMGERSLGVGRQLLSHIKALTSQERVLFVVSGGASALVDCPVDGLDNDEFLKKNRELYQKGYPIQELNRKRQKISQIKAGGLAGECRAEFMTWVLSDIPGDEWELVGSGPSIVCGSRAHFLIDDYRSCLKRLEKVLPELTWSQEAQNLAIDEAVKWHFSHLGESVLGEVLIELPSELGTGGRNTHFVALAGERAFKNENSGQDFFIFSVGTDGDDGNSQAAGAYLDLASYKRGVAQGLDISDYIARFDTANYFKRLGNLLSLGRKGHNVMDLRFISLP